MTDTPTDNPVPFLDLSPEIEEVADEVSAALDRVFRSGSFILGEEGAALEREIGRFLGVEHAVGLNSGTDALVIGLRALGIEPGDEVITSSFTFIATGEAIRRVGAVPVFADVEPDTLGLDPKSVEACVTPRTRALIPVHLFGCAADMDALGEIVRARNLRLFEDVAQAFGGRLKGHRLGSLGDAGALSFFPTKNLGAPGDAGMFVTDRGELADQVRLLRNHGQLPEYRYETFGYNSRLDELQAAALRVKLRHVDDWNERRRAVARRYTQGLADVPGLTLPREQPGSEHVFHQFTVRIAGGRRDALRTHLERRGIGARVYYPHPLHTLPLFGESPVRALPETERAADEVLSLPIWPALSEAAQDRVCAAIREFAGR